MGERYRRDWERHGLCWDSASFFELKQYVGVLSSLFYLERAQTLWLGDGAGETARAESCENMPDLALLLIRDGDFERGAELLHSALKTARFCRRFNSRWG